MLLLLVFSVIFVNCQESKSVWIDNSVLPYVDEFILEAKKRGKDVVPKIMDMEFIGFSRNLKFPIAGYVKKGDSVLVLNESIKFDSILFRAVVFHELGHAVLGLDHCIPKDGCEEGDIMFHETPATFSIYANEEFWQKKLDRLFN